MQLIRDVPSNKIKPCVAAIGNFDGIHGGHQEIINEVVAKAKALDLTPAVITFEPAPQVYLRKEAPFFRITTVREKLRILKMWGIQQVICLRFNKKLATLLAKEFITTYLSSYLNVRYLIVGTDFRFGFQQQGDIALLRAASEQGLFQLKVLDLHRKAQEKISSSGIRQALLQGDCRRAKSLLNRDYALSGKVVKNQQQGRLLGFPTANLRLSPRKVSLKGVFVTNALVEGKKYQAVTNVGLRPTIDGKNHWIETHLLDYNGDLYGKRLEISFLHKIRDEIKFADIKQLQQQIEKDVDYAKWYFLDQGQ